MLMAPIESIPTDWDFIDWGLQHVQYSLEQQTVELALGGPAGRTDWRFEARFRKIVHFRVYSEFEVYLWKEWEQEDPVILFREYSAAVDMLPSLNSKFNGIYLALPLDASGMTSEKKVAPTGAVLRAFALITNSITLNILCTEAELRTNVPLQTQ